MRVSRDEWPTARIWHEHADADGQPAAYAGTPTATTYNAAGTLLDTVAVTAVGAGIYYADLSAETKANYPIGDWYEAAWTYSAVEYERVPLEVVSRRLFAIAALRAYEPDFGDKAGFPTRTLEAARLAVEHAFERIMRRSFTGRARTETLDGTDTDTLLVSERDLVAVTAASIDGTALTAGELLDLKLYPTGAITWDGGSWSSGIANVSVTYSYGPESVPEPLRRAGLAYARHLLVNSIAESSDRATAVFTEAGGFRLSIAGRDGPTGLPAVDAVLAQYGYGKPSAFA